MQLLQGYFKIHQRRDTNEAETEIYNSLFTKQYWAYLEEHNPVYTLLYIQTCNFGQGTGGPRLGQLHTISVHITAFAHKIPMTTMAKYNSGTK